MTASRYYHATDGTFRKILPAGRARSEIDGYRQAAVWLPVPRLLAVRETPSGCEFIYEDVFASDRSTGLLADCINDADRSPGLVPRVRRLVSEVCDTLLAASALTGEVRPLEECVTALHIARLAPGGRLERWYGGLPDPSWLLCGQRLSLTDLADRTLVAGGRELGPGWPITVPELRNLLVGRTRWRSAITQGDVTEPNIAFPLCWLDFEYAGRNALAADGANLMWYLLGMGGWLVPAYQPGTYRRTLRRPVPPLITPCVRHLAVTTNRVEIDCAWQVGPGRRAAIDTLLRRLAGDLGAAMAPGGNVEAALRPFLAVRILGVIPLQQMSGPHALTCLAALAELLQPAWGLPDWCSTESVDTPPGFSISQTASLPSDIERHDAE